MQRMLLHQDPFFSQIQSKDCSISFHCDELLVARFKCKLYKGIIASTALDDGDDGVGFSRESDSGLSSFFLFLVQIFSKKIKQSIKIISMCTPKNRQPSISPRHSPLTQRPHTVWIQRVLFPQHPCRQCLNRVSWKHRNHCLRQNWPCVVLFIHKMHCGTRESSTRAYHSIMNSAPVHPLPTERRQQAWVDVQNGARERTH